ncbi:MAG: 4Fe-4S binding protein [Clostridia bacterium]|nr:4Fe-4S binding protein [Clostridia bacterium]
MAHIVTDDCIACGACADTCPVGAIQVTDKAIIDKDVCVDCGACAESCPVSAIQPE